MTTGYSTSTIIAGLNYLKALNIISLTRVIAPHGGYLPIKVSINNYDLTKQPIVKPINPYDEIKKGIEIKALANFIYEDDVVANNNGTYLM